MDIIKYLKRWEVSLGVMSLMLIILFGLPSPEIRKPIYELYLAILWGLMAIAFHSTYFTWNTTPWNRKVIGIAAPIVSVLYLWKYLT